MKEFLEAAKWLVEHGATGVLALACVIQGAAIYKLWQDKDNSTKEHAKAIEKRDAEHSKALMEVNEARIDDMQALAARSEALHDKVYKTAADLDKAIDFVKENRRAR